MTGETVEYEHGVAIPGRILPESEWARTAVKRLPQPGPLDWAAVFGRTAPVVLDPLCGRPHKGSSVVFNLMWRPARFPDLHAGSATSDTT